MFTGNIITFKYFVQ